MREIKFRGWNRFHKEMFEISKIDFKHGIVEAYDSSGNSYHTFGMIDMILEQYTNLKDKNGKEIYEGDIVTLGAHWNKPTNERTKAEVIYMGAMYRLKHDHTITVLNDGVEIIGNIHEGVKG